MDGGENVMRYYKVVENDKSITIGAGHTSIKDTETNKTEIGGRVISASPIWTGGAY